MCQVKPEYEKHVRYENGRKVLYLLVIREIYGCIKSILLWYNLFLTPLEVLGFEINPCDDNKLSHKNLEVILDIINEVNKRIGDIYFVLGNNHTFLGINIYCT